MFYGHFTWILPMFYDFQLSSNASKVMRLFIARPSGDALSAFGIDAP
jgi:hypothetical protein